MAKMGIYRKVSLGGSLAALRKVLCALDEELVFVEFVVAHFQFRPLTSCVPTSPPNGPADLCGPIALPAAFKRPQP
jgi:hypothetical protein